MAGALETFLQIRKCKETIRDTCIRVFRPLAINASHIRELHSFAKVDRPGQDDIPHSNPSSDFNKAGLSARLEQFPHESENHVPFVPREHFPFSDSTPRSYFLGHHKAGLDKMKRILNDVDLIIECRDYRIPMTSRNRHLELELGLTSKGTSEIEASGMVGSWKKQPKFGLNASMPGRAKARIVVFVKWDLGRELFVTSGRAKKGEEHDAKLQQLHSPTAIHFYTSASSLHQDSSHSTTRALHLSNRTSRNIITEIKDFALQNFSLTGHRVLVCGVPNVGKSTLLNALRTAGLGKEKKKGKAAKTGGMSGVTRSVGTAVKILDREDIEPSPPSSSPCAVEGEEMGRSKGNVKNEKKEATREGVYLIDTPGVFMPYVSSPMEMMKLALCGCTKENLIQPVELADFLLYMINLRGDPGVYLKWLESSSSHYEQTHGFKIGGGRNADTQPTNDIIKLLTGIAKKTGRHVHRDRRSKLDHYNQDSFSNKKDRKEKADWDLESAAIFFVKMWRDGKMGRFGLDDLPDSIDEVYNGLGVEGERPVSISQARKMAREVKKEKSTVTKR